MADNVASVPFMVTAKMKADLLAAGFTADEIKDMTPSQAWENLGGMPQAGSDAVHPNFAQALYLAGELGWHVFPCGPDKKPATGHGFKDATRDLDQVRRMWERNPGALIGVYCKGSGFFALDVDVKNGVNGNATLNEFIRTSGTAGIECGPVQTTPSGGQHWLFKMPDEVKVPNNAGKLGAGLDLRSDGYICTGVLPDGSGYAWYEGHGPDAPIGNAPGWLLEKIRNLTAKPAAKPQPPAPRAAALTAPETIDPGAYWLAHYLAEAQPGSRNETGFKLAGQLRDSGLSEGEARALMIQYAAGVPGSGYTEREALASLESAYLAPAREPATLPRQHSNGHKPAAQPPEMPEDWDQQAPPEDIDTNGQPATGQPTQARTAAQGAPTAQPANISTRFSTFADLEGAIGPVEFAWSVWLPDGMLTILASESGVGKSLLIMRVCGCFLLELPWPDGTPFTGEPGSVLWCEAEAAQSINLERAKAWGYPLDKIILPFEDPLTDVNLDNLAHQAAITQKAQMPEVRLIVVDSLSGSTSKKENDTEIKKITEFLARMARDTGKPVILTHHLNKAIFGNTEVTMDRLRGSTAIVQHARVIWALDCPNQTTPENKRLKMIKNNLRKFAAPIGVTATDKGLIFGAAPTAPRDLSQSEQAQALLQELLADGPVKSKTIEAAADAKGISWRTVNQAKKNMGIIDRREGGGKGSGITWQFPEASDDTL